MADERDEKELAETGHKQTIGGQQSHRSEYGEQGAQTDESEDEPIGGDDRDTGSGVGSAPRHSLGVTHGTEVGHAADRGEPGQMPGQQGQSGTGQADLGSQADSTLSGQTDQQDLGQDQPGSVAGASGKQGEGFIGAQGTGSDDLVEGSAAAAHATGGADFAEQGRGAPEDGEDDEEDGGGRAT